MTEVALGVVMFTGVILALVAVLLAARRRLVPSGEVAITVNEDASRALRAQAGTTLLGALAANRIFIPSACGGKGACGVCEVVVREGGGALLPTEAGFVSRSDARRGVRLACQVKVRGDLRIELPPETFSVRRLECRVASNRNVGTFIKELKLELPPGEEIAFRAGGYMQLECPPYALSFRDFDIDPAFRGAWDRFDLWRFRSQSAVPVERAYSLASYPLEKGLLLFTIKIAFPPGYREDVPPGLMSSWLFNLRPGDTVTASGPYGEFYARDTEKEMCFIGAGAGMAPLRSHIFDQFYRLRTKRKVTFWYAAANLREAFYREDFDRLQREHPNFSWQLVLSEPLPEDHWQGPVGLARNKVVRELYLKDHPAPEEIEYYLCGPPVMTKALIAMLADLGVERENIMLDEFG
jgi:Na+-transporting NADH:ubiquinone oxidoreductase subunit F